MRRFIAYLMPLILICTIFSGCQHMKDSDAKNKTFSAMSEIEKREYVNEYLSKKYGKETICDTEIEKKQTERDFKTEAHTKTDKFTLWISPAGEITDTYFSIYAKKCLEKDLSDIAAFHFTDYKVFVTYEFTNYPEKIYRAAEWKEMFQNEMKRNSIHDMTVNLFLPDSGNYYIDDHEIKNFIYDIKYLSRGIVNTYLVKDPKNQDIDELPERTYYKYEIKDNTPEVITPTINSTVPNAP